MIRLTGLMAACLLVTACDDMALPELPGLRNTAASGPAAREYPVQDAACVSAVRTRMRTVNVRVESRDPEGDLVRVSMLVGADSAPWTCTSDAAGNVSNVGPVGAPAPAAPISATPSPAAPSPAPAAPPPPAAAPTPPPAAPMADPG
ncbi:hypothetical protein [Roseisalinus antarcticus]|uniref:Uncharacterized protein n=1 Tax=Roseisalinus antarcticus TaxID=254357 RepID=A0A1Y5T8T8_9RHOB|nr:hypothetical protein [Roseisalinus antarcticus]SLN58180.1 hypothetical protein ROA7023_02654 [Roseisalinus antarcticus]